MLKALLCVMPVWAINEIYGRISPSCPSEAPCFYELWGPREIKYFEPWAYESIPGWAIVEYGLNACLWQTSSSCCRGGVPSKRPFEISYMTQKFAVCLPKKNPDDQECSEFQSAFPLTTVLWPRPNCSFCLDTTTTTTTRVSDWMPVTEWENQACSGSASDYVETDVVTLEMCKARCLEMAFCKGIGYLGTKCQLWTNLEGIHRTYGLQGSRCLRYIPAKVFTVLDGGIDRACRGAHASDNPPHNYMVMKASSLQECQKICALWQGCKGIEWNFHTRCEIWTRAQGIEAVQYVPGHSCMSYIPMPNAQTLYP